MRCGRLALGITTAVFLIGIGLLLWDKTHGLPGNVVILPLLGTSMEPAFNGPAFRWLCPQCHATFDTSFNITGDSTDEQHATETQNWLRTLRTTQCPECGFAEVPFPKDSFIPGDRVAFHQYGISLFGPQRFDTIVFRQENRLVVKRVVGLPGEQIQIQNGDLYINGILNVKSEAEFRRMAVPLRHMEQVERSDRILFVHCVPVPYLTEEANTKRGTKCEAPITNVAPRLSLDSIPSDSVEYVRDFLLDFDFVYHRETPNDPLTILVPYGNRVCYMQFCPGENRAKIAIQSASGPPASWPVEFPRNKAIFDCPVSPELRNRLDNGQTIPVTVCCADGRLSLKMDSRLLLAIFLEQEAKEPVVPVSIPFILAQMGHEIKNARVVRDIHWTKVQSTFFDSMIPPGHYCLLGDNSPVSIDSRQTGFLKIMGR